MLPTLYYLLAAGSLTLIAMYAMAISDPLLIAR